MTPFAQMLQTQAMLNVTGAERYATIPDEIVRYAIGRFGRPNRPIAPDVMDRIAASPRATELAAEPEMAPLAALRGRVGAHLSDEDFLLRATMPAAMVDAIAPAPRQYDPKTRAAIALIEHLCARTDLTRITVEKPGFRLELASDR
jgi:oxaloacetate decarboxylase alpha subunit